MLGGRAGSRQGRYTPAASTYVFGSHDLCLYLHQTSWCTWGYSGAGGMDVLMCPKEMARPPQARAADLIERWMMGSRRRSSPPPPPPARAVEPRFRGSFRPRRLEDRAYPTTATSSSIVHCHHPHSLDLAGRGQHWAPGESYIPVWSANARRIRNSAGKVIGLYKSDTNILGKLC